MNVEHHLIRLLYAHDCVIVPGFGGFICDPVRSEIDDSRRVAFPPSKKIAFNAELRKNDGLLASYIATAEKIEYADAFLGIQRYVAASLATLESRKQLDIETLGALYLDGGRHIHFKPESGRPFRYDSFGLAPLQLSPLPGRYEAPPDAHHTARRRLPVPVVRALQLLPVAALLVFVAMLPALAPRMDRTLSGIFPMYRLATDAPPDAPPQAYVPEPAATEVRATYAEAPVHNEEGTPPAAVETPTGSGEEAAAPSVTAPVTTPPAPPAEGHAATGHYYVVVGCFGVKENAVAFTAQLQGRGYPAEDIGPNRAGLTMVSASAHATLADAEAALPVIRGDVIASAWIFHRPQQ